MATRRDITAGPSKFDLMLSLFEGKQVTFSIDVHGKLEAKILSVEAEDGSHESWNIKGYVLAAENQKSFDAYYSTKQRKGSILVPRT